MPDDVTLPETRAQAPGARSRRAPVVREALTVTVRDVMVQRPKTLHPDTSIAEAAAAFAGGHVHLLLLTDGPTLIGTVALVDLPHAGATSRDGGGPALRYATLQGRTVSPDALVADVERSMLARDLRRLAVVDDSGSLLGLLCLKRRQGGFCSDDDVASRASDMPLVGRPADPSRSAFSAESTRRRTGASATDPASALARSGRRSASRRRASDSSQQSG